MLAKEEKYFGLIDHEEWVTYSAEEDGHMTAHTVQKHQPHRLLIWAHHSCSAYYTTLLTLLYAATN